MKNIYVVWLKGRLLVARWDSPEVILTDFYLPDAGYQPGEYVGVVDVPDGIKWEYEFILDHQSNRDNPKLLSFPRSDPVFDWQNFTGETNQIGEMKSKMFFYPLRAMTVEERNELLLPALPKDIWVEECFRLGINPLEVVVKQFPGWKWDCQYLTEAPPTGLATWVSHTGERGKYFVFESNFSPLFVRLVAKRIELA